MIGVKRRLKLGAPKPPKSVKKKRLLKTVQPIPDPDDATVVPNPYTEYMDQKPSELMYEKPYVQDPSDQASCSLETPVTEVLEEGDIPSVEDTLEFPNKLPYLMGERYQELLKKVKPSELIPGNPPSLTWLEERYGHLVEKDFWYDRLVKLASTFKETCEGDVFDMTDTELEAVVGHLVPHTEEEKEYLQLLDNYKQSPVQIDGIPTLEFLRKYHSKPPTAQDRARMLQAEWIPPTHHANITRAALEDVMTEAPSSPEYLPSYSEEEEEDLVKKAMEVENRYVDTYYCPIHEEQEMQCLNPDEVCGALFFKCGLPDCAVFFTSDNYQDVCHQLRYAIHPTVHQGLYRTDLKCHCDYTPRMKLSRTDKNYGRVFLTCFKKNAPCAYFQWVHWKVREPKGPMDAYVQKQSRGTWHRPAYQKYQRQPHSQQLVRTGLERFKKDDVKMIPPKRRWGQKQGMDKTTLQRLRANNPWGITKSFPKDYPWGPDKPKQQGFHPSPHYQNTEFRNGLYIGKKKPSPFLTSPYFTGNHNTTGCVPF